MRAAKLIVITGPSGVGKGTLVRSLLQRHPELYLSVSATTRPPRQGEINGRHYWFIDRNQFQSLIEAQAFIEWAQYAGNYYGTLRDKVETQLDAGVSVLLEIELVGARQIKQNFPTALTIFILPPSTTELERRLRARGQDSADSIARRLERAKVELAASGEFDHQIVNDCLTSAVDQLEAIIEN